MNGFKKMVGEIIWFTQIHGMQVCMAEIGQDYWVFDTIVCVWGHRCHLCHPFWLESNLQVCFMFFLKSAWDSCVSTSFCFEGKIRFVFKLFTQVANVSFGPGNPLISTNRRQRPSWNERSWSKAQWRPTFASSIPSLTLVPRSREGWRWMMDESGRVS